MVSRRIVENGRLRDLDRSMSAACVSPLVVRIDCVTFLISAIGNGDFGGKKWAWTEVLQYILFK